MQISIPVSIGELFDKISILKLKSDKIKDAKANENIVKEYKLLIAKAKEVDPQFQRTNLFKDLHKINSYLWKVEDAKREHERKKNFDAKFITWARRVYFYNDKRANVKKAINLKYGSSIIEEKSYKKY
jgi:hypothetical protein